MSGQMANFKEFISREDYKAAEKLFLEETDALLDQDEFDAILDYIGAFPEKYSQNSTILSLYYHISSLMELNRGRTASYLTAPSQIRRAVLPHRALRICSLTH